MQNSPNWYLEEDEIRCSAFDFDATPLLRLHSNCCFFAPSVLGIPIYGVVTLGILIGVFIIVVAFAPTGIYVCRAEFRLRVLKTAAHRGGEAMSGVFPLRLRARPATAALSLGLTLGLVLTALRRRSAFLRRPEAADQLDRHRHVPDLRGGGRWSSPTGPPSRTKTAKHFDSAGGGITGLQNGLAIAGDYMSAASFSLAIRRSSIPRVSHGLIYSIRLPGRLADHPVPDRRAAAQSRQVHLRRCGVLPPAADADRLLAACGSLVVVALYLIAQMVGAGKAKSGPP